MNKKTTYLFFLLCFTIWHFSAQVQEPFSVRFSESMKGDFTTIANNMLSRSATGNYNGNNDNHNFSDNVYVDIDNDPTTFNSSSANFVNPSTTTSCISVFKAFIYWAAADTERINGNDNQPNWNFDDIKLMLPGETSYTTITADDVIFRGRDTHFSNDPYICVKDITTEVMALPNKYGKYQVANVEAAEGQLSHSSVGTSGGWQIVFVYESPDLPSKNITIFDGYAHVSSFVNNFDILFDGFQTTPVGNVNANVVMGVLEGDRNLTGDRLQILNVANNFVDITAPQRNATNFFNSRITVGNGDYVDRNPASTNTLGFDAAVFQLNNPSNTIITNNQTSATLRLTSTQEVYGLYLLGLAVEVYQPDLNPMVITQTSGTNPSNPGDILGFNFNIENTGNDNAVDVEITTTIPPQATLLPITNLPTGVSYTYNMPTGLLNFVIEDGILDIGDPQIDIEFELQINDVCYFLEDDCDLSFDLQFTASYIGAENPDPVITSSTSDPTSCVALPYSVVIDQPVVNWLTLAGALDVTLSCEDAAGLAAAQTLEPEPDKCVFILNKTSGPFVVGNCPNVGTYTNTWNFTDACGVTIADYVQTITITDDIDPTASDPVTVNVQCIEDVPLPDIAVVTDAADNCSVPVVAFVSDVSDNLSCPETITRTYSVTDACGNSIEVYQSIIISDDIDPTASDPATVNVQCIDDVPLPDIAVVTDAADNCSVPVVAFVSDVSDNLSCPETITRTYSVTDACGNSIEVYQSIVISDDINPTASDPATVNVQCIDDVPLPDIAVVTDAADNCSIPTVAFVSDISDNLSCPETITRTYSVTDACGNSIEVYQSIVISDDIDPTASDPATVNVQCIDDVPLPDIAVVTDAIDNCSVPTIAFISDVSDNLSCPETIIRTYSVTDACGNSIEVYQSIIISDDIDPTASNPVTVNVQCIEDVPLPDIAMVTDATDNCSVPVVAFVSDVSDNLSCPETITRTYSVTDACGNSIEVYQSIVISDDINPTASDPVTVNVQCIEDVPLPDIAVVTDATDNCSVPTIAFVSDVSDNLSCPETITRTYSVTDACGNSIEVYQSIIIRDDINPTASDPTAINVQCIDDVPLPDIAVVTNVTDNCSVPVVAFVSDVSDNLSCPETITRTYSVTDACGNSIEVYQSIIISDDIDPTASDPLAVNVQCIDDVPLPDIAVVTDAADNCSVPVVAFVSDVSDNLSCPETITRTYSVTDACGNSIEVYQSIVISDDIDPTASDPATINVQCIDDVPLPDIAVVTDAADNCSVPTVAFVSDVSDNLSCPETITRTYSVTDACGNSIEVYQNIIVGDDIAPVLDSEFDTEIYITCEDIPALPDLLFTDNCTVDITVDYNEDIITYDEFSYDIIRNWMAMDDCGNQSIVSQTLFVRSSNESDTAFTTLCIDDDPIDLSAFITNTDEMDGEWQGDHMELLEGSIFNPSNTDTGTYEFIYTYSENNCAWTTIITILLNDDCVPDPDPCIISADDVKISKLVTANSDGYNDFFEVDYKLNNDRNVACDIAVHVQLFNRWGVRVFEAENYADDWSGVAPSSAIGTSGLLPTGTYYYIVTLLNSGLDPIKGFILLGTD